MFDLNSSGLVDLCDLLARYVEYRDILNFLIGMGKEKYNLSKPHLDIILQMFIKERKVKQIESTSLFEVSLSYMVDVTGVETGFMNRGIFAPHCISEPFEYYQDELVAKTIMIDGSTKKHFESNVCESRLYKYGKLIKRTDYKMGYPVIEELYSPKGCTIINLSTYGEIKMKRHIKDGKKHCTNGPALVRFRSRGTCRVYYIKGKRHRVDGPAYTYKSNDNKLYLEKWYLDSKRHRIGGPAYTLKRNDEIYERWYEHGVLIKSTTHNYYIDSDDSDCSNNEDDSEN